MERLAERLEGLRGRVALERLAEGLEGLRPGKQNRWPWCLAARVAESWLGNACARRCVAPSVALEKAWKGLRKAVLP